MKKLFAAVILLASTPLFAADVGVSVSIGQPGFYGQIDIGNQYSRPALIYSQPVVIQPVQVIRQPMYLHVPRGHAKNWRKHCRQYGACGTPVYFVQDNWYNNVYVPEYRQHKHKDRGHPGKGHGHGNGHGNGHKD